MICNKIQKHISNINRYYRTINHTEFRVLKADINAQGNIKRLYGWIKKGEKLIHASWFPDGTFYNPRNKGYRGFDLIRTISIK